MLSAIAARKAAQAAHPTVQNADPIPEVSAMEQSSESEEENVRDSVKRRSPPSRLVGHGRNKKHKNARTSSPRYFAAKRDAFQNQADVVIIESDEENASNPTSTDASSSAEDRLPMERPWSPSVPLHDEDEEPTKDEPQTPIPPIQTLTTFKPAPNRNVFHLSPAQLQEANLSPALGALLVLSIAETICIAGTYQLTVLQGTVSLLGANLSASTTTHRVFAPKSSPLPVIEALSSKPSVLNTESSHRLGLVGASGAVIAIQELRTGVQGLGHVCKIFSGDFDFTQEEARQWEEKVLQVPGTYVLRTKEKYYEPHILPKSWTATFKNLDPPSTGGVYFVKGAKKSGKSTFARTLLNRLLTRFERVAYLECDLGQSEFTPGGMVALHVIEDYCLGPPFTHPTIPIAAHYIGGTSPRSSPAHYLASVQALFQTFELDIRNPLLPYGGRVDISTEDELLVRMSDSIPLVVNTMGWHKGLGADLTQRIQDIVQPTHIFDFCVQKSFGNHKNIGNTVLGYEQTPHSYAQIDPIVLSPASPLHTQYTPADRRVINILSYLHAMFPPLSPERVEPSTVSLEQTTVTSWRTALPLCSQPPYAVDCQTALDRIVLVGGGTEDVTPAEVGHVLNGALVGIVSSWGADGVINPEKAMEDVQGQPLSQDLSSQMPYVQCASPPIPASSTCIGLALVRSVSHCSPLAATRTTAGVEKELHVLTPVPPSLLKHARILVKGEMELPVWGMLDYSGDEDGWKKGVTGVEWEKVPYLQWGKGEGVGAEKRRVRRNLMRKAQM
ncbi:hypothetical protein JOM56_006957 [Amanita muscaria]